jgi:hypothetical protein
MRRRGEITPGFFLLFRIAGASASSGAAEWEATVLPAPGTWSVVPRRSAGLSNAPVRQASRASAWRDWIDRQVGGLSRSFAGPWWLRSVSRRGLGGDHEHPTAVRTLDPFAGQLVLDLQVLLATRTLDTDGHHRPLPITTRCAARGTLSNRRPAENSLEVKEESSRSCTSARSSIACRYQQR